MSFVKMKSPPEPPWIFRTYGGYATAEDSNRLYHGNLAKGQTGLSVAFDLPTQLGYDSDHPLARDEVGKVGVPISHILDMRKLMDGLALDQMNTSMTINATAAWLLALYIAVADEQGVPRDALKGTTQNDIIKEYLSRGTYVFPPEPSLKLTADVISFCARELPKWNPINVCSYHLQEAGAEPVEELAFALSTAIAVLDEVQRQGEVSTQGFSRVVGRVSFFINAGMKFITEICKVRAFAELWDEICRERYGVGQEEYRRFRYGVQVNSLGLTEQQPENNVYRILIEMLGAVLSRNCRARAVQLPAWNEALGLPRPWDQQWSLRMQQIVAFETDLLEYDDIFDGSAEIERKTRAFKDAARDELEHVLELGGAVKAIEQGYMKERLVRSNRARLQAIESGTRIVVGVNAFTESEASPFVGAQTVMSVKDDIGYERSEALKAWRRKRNGAAVEQALEALKQTARAGKNLMKASITCAKVGVTTGEWGASLREVFGEYRAPTGVVLPRLTEAKAQAEALIVAVRRISSRLGTRLRLLIGKPGLDGHSNGAEQLALRAAQCGIDVRYDGIRLSPREIAQSARESKVHVIGLSILSGSHVVLVREVLKELRDLGVENLPLVVGGIIPPEDVHVLKQLGVKRVYTPKDFEIDRVITGMVETVEETLDEGIT
jgi:(2R)-ethylmalonyl-CoA mutase